MPAHFKKFPPKHAFDNDVQINYADPVNNEADPVNNVQVFPPGYKKPSIHNTRIKDLAAGAGKKYNYKIKIIHLNAAQKNSFILLMEKRLNSSYKGLITTSLILRMEIRLLSTSNRIVVMTGRVYSHYR